MKRTIFWFVAAVVALCAGPGAGHAAYPGTNGQIVVLKVVSGGPLPGASELWLMDADGLNARAFLTAPHAASSVMRDPRWSPNGRRLAFIMKTLGSGPAGPYPNILWIADGDGASLGFVTALSTAVGARPTWSPDGTKIAYGDADGVHVVDLKSGANTLLAANAGNVKYDQAAWSPTGASIAMRRSETGVGPFGIEKDIVVISASGGTVTNLTRPSQVFLGRDAGSPDWAPDGSKILFHRGDQQASAPPNTPLETVDPTSGVITDVVASGNLRDAAYSPDGTRIVCLEKNLGLLSTLNADGSNLQFIDSHVGNPYYGPADWRPVSIDDDLQLTLSPSRQDQFGLTHAYVDADGFHSSTGTATLRDRTGQPIPGAAVLVRPNILADPQTTANPRLLAARADGKRVWPNRFGDGRLDLVTLSSVLTDSQGVATFHLWAGTQIGPQLLIDVVESGVPLVKSGQFLTFEGPAAPSIVPEDALLNEMRLRLDPLTSACIPSATGTAAQKQDVFLEWLLFTRYQVATDTSLAASFGQVEFAPVHTGNGHAGIVFYPRGTNPNPLLDYFAKMGTPGDPTKWLVLDMDEFQTNAAQNNQPQIVIADPNGNIRTLAQWETAVGGAALPGRLVPYPEEDLTYFGWPYPPPIGVPALHADRRLFDQCVPLPGLSVAVHSPVNLLFDDGHGHAFGVDASGQAHWDLPGVLVRSKKKNPTAYFLPSGDYTTTVAGTGGGAATVVFTSGEDSTVFALRSKKGATATLAVDDATGPAQQVTFGGKSYASTSGLRFKVSGAPKTVKTGKRLTLTIRVADPFKAPVRGAEVALVVGSSRFAATTDAKGVAKVAVLLEKQKATGSLKVSAPGYVDAVVVVKAK